VSKEVYGYSVLPLPDILTGMINAGLMGDAPAHALGRWMLSPADIAYPRSHNFGVVMGPMRGTAFRALLLWLFDDYEASVSPLRRVLKARFSELDHEHWVWYLRGVAFACHHSRVASKVYDLTSAIIQRSPGIGALELPGDEDGRRQQLADLFLATATEFGSLPLANHALDMMRGPSGRHLGTPVPTMRTVALAVHRHTQREQDWRARRAGVLVECADRIFKDYMPTVIASRQATLLREYGDPSRSAFAKRGPLGSAHHSAAAGRGQQACADNPQLSAVGGGQGVPLSSVLPRACTVPLSDGDATQDQGAGLSCAIREQARRDASVLRLGASALLDPAAMITEDECRVVAGNRVRLAEHLAAARSTLDAIAEEAQAAVHGRAPSCSGQGSEGAGAEDPRADEDLSEADCPEMAAASPVTVFDASGGMAELTPEPAFGSDLDTDEDEAEEEAGFAGLGVVSAPDAMGGGGDAESAMCDDDNSDDDDDDESDVDVCVSGGSAESMKPRRVEAAGSRGWPLGTVGGLKRAAQGTPAGLGTGLTHLHALQSKVPRNAPSQDDDDDRMHRRARLSRVLRAVGMVGETKLERNMLRRGMRLTGKAVESHRKLAVRDASLKAGALHMARAGRVKGSGYHVGL
jgi:hypothetical protein